MFHAKKKYCVNIYSPVTKIFNFFILNVNARYNNDTVGLENFAEKEQQIFNFILSWKSWKERSQIQTKKFFSIFQ